MSTLLLSHVDCIAHEVPPGHPERPDRMRAVQKALSHEIFDPLIREDAREATHQEILLVHPESHIRLIADNVPQDGFVGIDGDTTLSAGSYRAGLLAAGGAVRAVDAVLNKEVRNAFVATRPPGHHAETATAMGFCLFNNAAIAARHARKTYGIGRVVIVDFDVHHGNGTQEIFWADRNVMYCSTHQMPLYPGTGAMNERGDHNQIINAPMEAGDGGRVFREAFDTLILPSIDDFRPELVIISAGFDAHQRDPLGSLTLVEADFAWATLKLMDMAEKTADSRVVSLLEGGYDLQGLAGSVSAHVQALMRG